MSFLELVFFDRNFSVVSLKNCDTLFKSMYPDEINPKDNFWSPIFWNSATADI